MVSNELKFLERKESIIKQSGSIDQPKAKRIDRIQSMGSQRVQ